MEFVLCKFLGKICVCVNLKTIFSKALLCHTELSQESEVSIKSKCDFNVLKCLKFCGYFANAQYDNMDFSLVSLTQNDK